MTLADLVDAVVNFGDAALLDQTSRMLIALGVLSFLGLMFMEAPYGRYQASDNSILSAFPINGKLAWVLQELPCFLFAVLFFRHADPAVFGTPNKILLGLYLLHYTNRTLVFPLRIRQGKPTPILVFLMALGFCLVNGFLQSKFLAQVQKFDDRWEENPQFVLGVVLFFVGMYINLDSDAILRSLRRSDSDRGYAIPRGGMFEYVSGANFFGEIIEWTGFAIAANSLPASAFAIFTFCNIGPRALQHHRWYLSFFDGGKDKPLYPQDRAALIPFVL